MRCARVTLAAALLCENILTPGLCSLKAKLSANGFDANAKIRVKFLDRTFAHNRSQAGLISLRVILHQMTNYIVRIKFGVEL
jgi:hypothetical protein